MVDFISNSQNFIIEKGHKDIAIQGHEEKASFSFSELKTFRPDSVLQAGGNGQSPPYSETSTDIKWNTTTDNYCKNTPRPGKGADIAIKSGESTLEI